MNIVGVMRAGYTVFPISPRNSPAAVAHLLKKAQVTHVLIDAQDALKTLFTKSIEFLEEDIKSNLSSSSFLSFAEVHQSYTLGTVTEPPPVATFDLDNVAFIVHSSGSTAFPKPIFWTHYRFILLSWIPCESVLPSFFCLFVDWHPSDFGDRDMCGTRLACHSMPMCADPLFLWPSITAHTFLF